MRFQEIRGKDFYKRIKMIKENLIIFKNIKKTIIKINTIHKKKDLVLNKQKKISLKDSNTRRVLYKKNKNIKKNFMRKVKIIIIIISNSNSNFKKTSNKKVANSTNKIKKEIKINE